MHKQLLCAALVAAMAVVCPAQATLTSTSNAVAYTGNGATTAFTVPFKFLANSDLVVTLGGVTETLNTHYTVKGAGNATGTVTFTTAPATGAAVVITRSVALTQGTSLRSALPSPVGTVIETALDKTMMGEQQLATKESADFSSVSSAVAALNGTSHTVTDTSSVLAFGSTTPRTLTARFSDIGNVKDYGAACNGLLDDVSALVAAIAALPSTGGVIDARSCSQMTLGSTLTISKSAVTVLLPAATISLGANQIIVPVGVHNVALVGAATYGGSIASQTAGMGTFLTYTGTGVAIKVGDLTSDTYGFRLEDVTVGLTTAGTAAIGIQLNRAIQYVLRRPRVHGFQGANTQIAIDLEGGANFTGGRIEDQYLWNGNTGVYLGRNANANIISGGIIINNNTGGKCFNFAGAVGLAPAGGNTIVGGDCEALSGTAFTFDYATGNSLLGTRTEAVSTYINATANSFGNAAFMLPYAGVIPIIDNGVATSDPNSFNTMRAAQFNMTNWKLYNRTDTPSEFDLYSGVSTPQTIAIEFKKWDATRAWNIFKDASETLYMFDGANGSTPRIRMDTGTNSYFNSLGSGSILLNDIANAGTGGVLFGSGGASPTVVAKVDSAGRLTQTGTTFSALGTPVNGSLIYCSDCTIANPCAGGGTGAFAKRLNGAWICN